jgi:hypothetical protein
MYFYPFRPTQQQNCYEPEEAGWGGGGGGGMDTCVLGGCRSLRVRDRIIEGWRRRGGKIEKDNGSGLSYRACNLAPVYKYQKGADVGKM